MSDKKIILKEGVEQREITEEELAALKKTTGVRIKEEEENTFRKLDILNG